MGRTWAEPIGGERRGVPRWARHQDDYRGAVRLTDAAGEHHLAEATLDWVNDDGDWTGVLSGPLPWSTFADGPLTLELLENRWWDVPFVSPVEIDIVVGQRAGVHGRVRHLVSATHSMARSRRKAS